MYSHKNLEANHPSANELIEEKFYWYTYDADIQDVHLAFSCQSTFVLVLDDFESVNRQMTTFASMHSAQESDRSILDLVPPSSYVYGIAYQDAFQ